jgi:hypothetical protein
MKTFRLVVMIATVATLSVAGSTAWAQDSTAPQLSSNTSGVLRMAKASIGDDTIIAYIKNSGNNYALDADQIIYLKQQGVSSTVLNAMLNQTGTIGTATTTVSAPDTTVATTATPAPVAQTILDSPAPASATEVVAPAVTYIQTPNTYYYASPAGFYSPIYVSPYCYSPYYYRPGVSVSFGWGGGFRGGFGGGHVGVGGFHGGGHGGWHR